jgi:hypothetical protein
MNEADTLLIVFAPTDYFGTNSIKLFASSECVYDKL